MKKVMKTLALLMAFVLLVDTPVSASVAAAGTMGQAELVLTAQTDEVEIDGNIVGTNDGTNDGTETSDGTVDGTDDGTDHGTNDGTDDGTDRIPQVIAVTVVGDAVDVEVGELIDFEATIITNTSDLKYDVDWSVAGGALELVTAKGGNATYRAVCGGKAVVTATATANRKSVSGDATVNVKEYVTEMHFAQDTYTSFLKHKVDMDDELVKNPSTANDAIYWSVDNKKIATVDAKGVVTMKKVGTVKLTAASERGVIATTTIDVKEGNPITRITLNKKTTTLEDYLAEEVITATITTKYEGETTDELVWTSAKPAFVTVEEKDEKSATITAVGVGKSKVTVKTSSGKSASVTVTAKAVLKDLDVYDEDGAVQGETYSLKKLTLHAERDPEVNKDKIRWSTSDKSIATVSGKKNDTALVTVKVKNKDIPEVEGKAVTITAEAGGKTAKYELTVKKSEITGIGKIQGQSTLSVGEKANYAAAIEGTGSPEEITWTSSSEKVLKIDAEGHAVAVKAGKATIKATVTLANGKTKSESMKVTVTQPATSLSMKKSVVTVVKGKKKTVAFTAVKAPKGAAGTINYELVGETKGATINKNKVTVPASAQAGDVITVKASVGNVSAMGVILVLDDKSKITFANPSISKNKISVEQGKSIELNTTITPVKNAAVETITYSVNKKGIATVDADGVVYGMLPGTVKITAKTTSGAKATVTVTVTAAQDDSEGTQDGGHEGTRDGKDGKK